MIKQSMEAACYTALCSDFDMKPEWLGKTVVDRGQTYTVSGLNIRSKKFPVTTKEGVSFSADYFRALMTNTVDAYKKKIQTAHQNKQERMLKEARTAFESSSILYDIPKSWLDKTFVYGRKMYTIVGIQTSSRRYPVVCRGNDGKVAYFTPSAVKESVDAYDTVKEAKKKK